MKSKKRHHTSSEESEDSDNSASSSSDSDSDDSSVSDHHYSKKKRKRADSSDSESDSDDHKRSKKRKHKKKKKKHSKKKRRSDSVVSVSAEEDFTLSEGEEVSTKKKRKHKHKHNKRPRSSSASGKDEENAQRRIHSVVKERRGTSEEEGQPARTYYQKEYHRSVTPEDFERQREVQRFYRGSSKERRHQYQQEQYQNEREYNDRHQRFEDHRSPEEQFQNRRPREQQERYHQREDPKGFNRFNQYEDRGPKRREFEDRRDFRERRPPPDNDRFREREFPERKERFHEEAFSSERPRDVRREKPMNAPGRPEKPSASHHRERSRSPEERYKNRPERNRRPDARVEQFKEGRGEERRERPPREDRNVERTRPPVKSEPRQRDRKTRFADADNDKEYTWGKEDAKKEDGKDPGDKEKPNFGLSGKLTADANTVNGVVIKYTEPEDAKQPKRRWRFYPFKGDKALPILYIHRQSAFLIGRDKKVVDIMLEHPSISKQHAALQYRATPFTRPDGSQGRRVRPYIIDLESANGTFVNNKKIEPRRYVELLERDVVKFGFSQREYVLLHENSKDDAQDDDHEPLAVTTTDQIKHDKRVKEEIAEDGD
ncbi:uncharacterized protein LOC142975866 isoform X2 [Anticarsia gemmatalis]|uniref:uncharacterized protein LOC142975866 isoform X2 n=1 Tax=Anticarsia gemmatalis TaxID=129554 RepID=UPI003F757B39